MRGPGARRGPKDDFMAKSMHSSTFRGSDPRFLRPGDRAPACVSPSVPPTPTGRARRALLGGLLGGLLLLVGGTGGCGRDHDPDPEGVPADARPVEVPPRGGVVRVLHEQVHDLDPRIVDDIYESTVVNQIHEGLVRYDPSLGIAPLLAESWIVSEDGLTYTFQLRDGVRFHDGTPLDGPAVVASLERVLAPDRPGECIAETYLLQIAGARDFRIGKANHIAGLAAPDRRSVTVRLEEPLSFFLFVLAMDQTRIVPAGVPGGLGPLPIGTGPFEFVRRERSGDFEDIVLGRNEDYWGEESALDSLVFVAPRNHTLGDEARIALLLAGQVDGISIPTGQASRLSGLGYRITASPELTVSFLGLQTAHPPLDDARVRRAIAHCLDHDAYAAAGGGGVLPAAGILPPGITGFPPTRRVLEFDPVRARGLLAEAGYGPEHPTPELTLFTTGDGPTTQFLRGAFREELRAVGVPIEVEVVPWTDLDRRVTAGSAPLFLLGWLADIPDADGFLYALFHSQAPNNLFAFHDPDLDRALVDARHMMPGQERLERYREIEARVVEAAPVVPLYHELTSFAWDPAVVGVELGPYGLPTVRFSTVHRVRADGLAAEAP